jgi:hypothetical protein
MAIVNHVETSVMYQDSKNPATLAKLRTIMFRAIRKSAPLLSSAVNL